MRLLKESDVIRAIDKHTREDGTLDDDVSVILEEVKTAFNVENIIKEIEYNKEISKKHSTGLREQGHVEAFNEVISIINKGGIK